jgi:hypothetical protein
VDFGFCEVVDDEGEMRVAVDEADGGGELVLIDEEVVGEVM